MGWLGVLEPPRLGVIDASVLALACKPTDPALALIAFPAWARPVTTPCMPPRGGAALAPLERAAARRRHLGRPGSAAIRQRAGSAEARRRHRWSARRRGGGAARRRGVGTAGARGGTAAASGRIRHVVVRRGGHFE
eukprot:scaffold18093_cov113-Phaeocystis_antarctica.AAC.1